MYREDKFAGANGDTGMVKAMLFKEKSERVYSTPSEHCQGGKCQNV